jgi:hypothetical protein
MLSVSVKKRGGIPKSEKSFLSQQSVNVTDVKIADPWAGDAEIRFIPSPFEEAADLGPLEVTGGFFFSLGTTITGGQAIHRY